jgi:hypothetical protein
LGIYYQLKTAIARRLYRLLDKRLYKKAELEIDIFELAAKLAMSDTYKYAADIWRKIVPGIQELKAIGFLEDATRKKVGKYTRVVFTRAQGQAIIALASNPSISTGSEDGEELARELEELGMEAQMAGTLTEAYDPLFIREKLNQLRKELRRNARSIQNPAGWLVSAIRKDFTSDQRRLPMPELQMDQMPLVPDERDSELDQTWKKVKDILEIQLTRATFDTNVRNTTLVALDGAIATIEVADELRISWLNERLKPKLTDALASVLGRDVELGFIVRES